MSHLPSRRAAAAAGLSLAAVTAGVLLAPAALAAEPLPALELSSTTLQTGGSFTVTGAGCFQLGKDQVGTTTAMVWTSFADVGGVTEVAEDGTWSVTTVFPPGTAGTHLVQATCDTYFEEQAYSPVQVTVTEPGAPSSPRPAASTAAPVSTPVPGAIRGASANTPGIVAKASSTSASTLAPGKQVTRVLTGFKPHEVVTLTMHSTPTVLGTFTADASGVVTAVFTIPAGTAGADHTFVYVGADGSYFQETLRVGTGTAVQPASSGLAYTGADVAVPLAVGGALVLAGGGALLLSRRRDAEATRA